MLDNIKDTVESLEQCGYLADEALATSVYLGLRMGRPLFLEGEPGVGKTELAKVLAEALHTDLIRLQCYEGLDLAQAVYEWDHPRQLLEIQARAAGSPAGAAEAATSTPKSSCSGDPCSMPSMRPASRPPCS